MRPAPAILLLSLLTGCSSSVYQAPEPQQAELFEPSAMRLHPVFSSVKDWTGDGQPDGIEALIELQDRFGDPTKATGRVIFELFDYRAYDPDPRGERVVNPYIGELLTLDQQAARWNRTSRTYGFELEYPRIDPTRNYVLTATFETVGGGRFFSRLILRGRPAERNATTEASGASTNLLPGGNLKDAAGTHPGDATPSGTAAGTAGGLGNSGSPIGSSPAPAVPATNPGSRTPEP